MDWKDRIYKVARLSERVCHITEGFFEVPIALVIKDGKRNWKLYDFEGFVTMTENWFCLSPPFDHVLLSEKGVYGGDYRQVVIPLKQIKFSIKKNDKDI